MVTLAAYYALHALVIAIVIAIVGAAVAAAGTTAGVIIHDMRKRKKDANISL